MANGLINLQTDLKSLRYGSETPYITKDINDPPSSSIIGMQASKRIDDTSRIVQMLASKPGLKYLANEALLKQASNLSKAEKAKRANKSIAGAILSQIGDTFVSTVKIVGSTLAQVPVNGTGTHFLKGFKTDTYLQPTGGDRVSKFAAFFGAGGIEGAPYALDGQIVPGTVEVGNQNFVQTSKTGRELELVPSQYSYDAAVFGDRNETKNTPIINKSLKGELNSSLASDGKTVSIKTSELKPIVGENADTEELTFLGGFSIPADILVGVETTPTKGVLTKQNLINSIPHTGSIAGDVNPDSSTNVISVSSSYSNTYTGKEAKTSINNAQTGAPIPTQFKRDTTVKNYLGSISIDASGSEQYPAPRNDTEFKEANTYTYNKAYADGEKKLITKTGYNYPKIETAISQSGDGDRLNDGTQKYFDDNTYIVEKQHYSTKNINVTKEARILLGDQGARKDENKKRNIYWTTTPDQKEIDTINSLSPSDGKVDGETQGRDLVKFRFHIVTPDQKEKVLYFRAFLDSFADNYSGQWNPVKYLGRAEDFQIYSGFQRKISLSFKIAAATRAEMKPIYEKMIWLASATAPTYADGGQFMRGTITKITMGDYIYELPGILNSVNYTWNTEYPWEIAMIEPENTGADDFEQELPMVMDCSIDFTPIHTFTPTTGLKKYITTDLTEKGKKGITNIDNSKTGIEPIPAIKEPSKPYTPSGIPFTAVAPSPAFGPQEPEDITIGLPGF